MKARFIILLVLAAGMGVYLTTMDRTVKEPPVEKPIVPPNASDLWRRTLIGCETPPEEEELAIQVWIDPAEGKNRLYFSMSETHGYYVDSCNMRFWWVGTYEGREYTEWADSPIQVSVPNHNIYVKADDTLEDFMGVQEFELAAVGGDLGTSENWRAAVDGCFHACLENPENIPVFIRTTDDYHIGG